MGLIDCKTSSGESTCEGCRKGPGVLTPRKLRIFRFQELAKATKSFSERSVLGKGSHSCVYKAVLRDGEVVAVKRPTLGRRTLQDAISFDNELDILSKMRHRHLVNLIGFCNESHEKLLVVEFMGNGTLYDRLHCSDEPLSWSARIHMALQAAKAVHALHSAYPPIIHRDVKSSNVLIDRNWNAKLSDLGLALRGQVDDVIRKEAPPAGTMGYIDPAYDTPSQLSSKSDVFSFGILLLEIMSGRKAIDVRFNPSSLVDWAVPLIRQGKALDVCDTALEPPQNLEVVEQLAAIAARAVRQLRDRRPTMAEVVEGLQRIRKKLPVPLFGGNRNSLRASRISIPRNGDVGEDSNSISAEGPPQIYISSLTKVRKEEMGQDDSGEGVPFLKRVEISRLTTVRKEAVGEGDSGKGGSSPKTDPLPIRNEGSGSGEGTSIPPSDSEHLSNHMGKRRGGRVNSNGDGLVSTVTATTPASSSTGVRVRATIKLESSIFDPSSAPTITSSPSRVDMMRNLAGSSPISPSSLGAPGRSANNCVMNRNIPTRRPLETPTFGSKGSVRMVDLPRTSVTTAAGGFSPQATDFSRLKRSGSSGPEHQAPKGEANYSKGGVELASQRSLREGGGGQVPQKRISKDNSQTPLLSRSSSNPHAQRSLRGGSSSQVALRRSVDTRGSPSSKPHEQLAPRRSLHGGKSEVPLRRNTVGVREAVQPPTSFSKPPPPESGQAAARKSKSYREVKGGDSNGASNIRPPVSFRMDVVVPICDTAAAKLCSNTEPHCTKVDLPIPV